MTQLRIWCRRGVVVTGFEQLSETGLQQELALVKITRHSFILNNRHSQFNNPMLTT